MASTDSAGSDGGVRDVEVAGVRIYGSSRLILFDDYFERRRTISIGRTRQRSIRVRDDSVSRLHCKLQRAPSGDWEIIDCDSYNGTYVAPSGRYSPFMRVERHPLYLGMQIRIGDITLVPVDRRGNSPIVASRQSEFIREAESMYGTSGTAARHIGLSRQTVRRLITRLKQILTRRGADE